MIIFDTQNEKTDSTDEQPNQGGGGDSAAKIVDQKVEATCSHCGLPVPLGWGNPEEEHQFCCAGCRTAFELITECQLDDFYHLADKRLAATPTLESEFEEFDSEYFVTTHTTEVADSNSELGLRKVTLLIEGLHCSACIWLLEKLPKICQEVVTATVNWNANSITLYYDANSRLSSIAKVLSHLGYQPSVYVSNSIHKKSKTENRKLLFDLGFAGAAAGNNMLVALALYLGQFYGMTTAIETVLVFYSGVISSISVFGPGKKILSKAVWAIRTRTPHMDMPVALGMTVGLAAGWINLLFGSSAVFFDSISVLVFVLLLGRYVQQMQQRAAVEKLSLLNGLIPRTCQRVDAGIAEKIDVDQVEVGDRLRILPEMTIPVDGVLVNGAASVDTSILTGESFPVALKESDQLYAGSQNVGGPLEMVAQATVGESKIATIFSDVENSIRKKTKIVQFADRIGARFVVLVMILALVTFLIWLPDWEFALNAMVAVMIVACPCALALATPVAISVALLSALGRKILIKDGDAFELLANCKTIWFDKTGTLTRGALTVKHWFGDTSIRPQVARIEAGISHPVAAAITYSVASQLGVAPETLEALPTESLQRSSNGVTAQLDGKLFQLGARKYFSDLSLSLSPDLKEKEKQFLAQGYSTVFVAVDSNVVALLAIGDQLREESPAMVRRLQKNFRVGLLSGDRKEIVAQTAEELGIPPEMCFAEKSPEEKSIIVKSSSHSLMIGDGVNDCSALAAADIGIAINDNVDSNSRVASIVLRSDQLEDVPAILQSGRRVMSLIRRNIAISLGYNVVTVALAMSGWIHPVIAAFFMPVSSISILLASLCSKPFQNSRSQ